MTRVSPLSLVEGISSRAFPLLGADGAPLLGRDGAPATLTLSLRFAAPDAAAEVERLKAEVEEARPGPRPTARSARKRGSRAQAARCE